MQYVNNWSLLLDMKILLDIVLTAFKHGGISEEGQVTMAESTGSSDKQSLDRDVSASAGS